MSPGPEDYIAILNQKLSDERASEIISIHTNPAENLAHKQEAECSLCSWSVSCTSLEWSLTSCAGRLITLCTMKRLTAEHTNKAVKVIVSENPCFSSSTLFLLGVWKLSSQMSFRHKGSESDAHVAGISVGSSRWLHSHALIRFCRGEPSLLALLTRAEDGRF